MNVLDLAQLKVMMRKVSGTNGGEWQGPCPECGGKDRFHVWPEQQEGKGGYWCRSCGKTGDNIQFLRDFEGLSFQDACARLNVPLPDLSNATKNYAERWKKPAFSPEKHDPPVDIWQEKAGKFAVWAQEKLINNTEVMAWLANRGINELAVKDYYLGWNPGEKEKDIYRPRQSWGLPEVLKDDGKPKKLWIPQGLVIPHIINGVVHRLRIRRPEGEPRYYVIPGSSMGTMIIREVRRAFVVVEAELDAIAVGENNRYAGAVALGSAAAKPDAAAFAILQGAVQILNALDYDEAGKKYMGWWTEHFSQCERWPVPKGKDPGEAFQLGMDLEQWIKAGLPPVLTIENPVPKAAETAKRDKVEATVADREREEEIIAIRNLSPEIVELRDLLRKNPAVKIINIKDRFAVLRDGKYVGGRINALVFTVPVVREYVLNHPAEEIDGGNLII